MYCEIPIENETLNSTHSITLNDTLNSINNATKKDQSYDLEHDAKTVQYKPWEKQAKQIDKYALILTPLLFLIVSIIYWTSYLSNGYVQNIPFQRLSILYY